MGTAALLPTGAARHLLQCASASSEPMQSRTALFSVQFGGAEPGGLWAVQLAFLEPMGTVRKAPRTSMGHLRFPRRVAGAEDRPRSAQRPSDVYG